MKEPNLRVGFSLLELVIIMLILAIITAVSMSAGGDLKHLRTNQAAYKIKTDIRYAQSYALSTQQRTRLSFTPASETYSIYTETSPDSWSLLTHPLEKVNFTVNFTSGEYSGTDIVQTNFDGTNYGLLFDASGSPHSYSPAGSTALLTSQGSITFGEGISVLVEPKTGKVSISH